MLKSKSIWNVFTSVCVSGFSVCVFSIQTLSCIYTFHVCPKGMNITLHLGNTSILYIPSALDSSGPYISRAPVYWISHFSMAIIFWIPHIHKSQVPQVPIFPGPYVPKSLYVLKSPLSLGPMFSSPHIPWDLKNSTLMPIVLEWDVQLCSVSVHLCLAYYFQSLVYLGPYICKTLIFKDLYSQWPLPPRPYISWTLYSQGHMLPNMYQCSCGPYFQVVYSQDSIILKLLDFIFPRNNITRA